MNAPTPLDGFASDAADAIPRRAQCLLSTGESFEGVVERVGPTGLFIRTDRPGLQYSEGIRVTLFDDHGPVSSFTGQVVTWVRGRGIRVEADHDVEPHTLEQLAEWASEQQFGLDPASTPDLVMAAPPSLPPAPGRVPAPAPGSRADAPVSNPDVPVSQPNLPAGRPGSPSIPEHRARSVTAPNLHRAASEALKGTRVLIIDDDPLVLRMLSRGLRRFGCEVQGCDNPPEALEMLQQADHDVVLLDWVLPVIPGAEMLEKLRRFSPVPIAVVSGALWWERAADQIRAMGASAVLEKPVDFEQLVAWIQRVHGEQPSS